MWRTRSDMAYTKIKPVRHHLQRCLDYTSNPQKTETFSANDLNCLLSYTQNQDKTEHQLYVTGFNCTPADACRRMYRTKKRLNQPVDDGSILAYHIIQSFSPGEATPEQVHQIGCEFARRFLADRFECTVSTHLDNRREWASSAGGQKPDCCQPQKHLQTADCLRLHSALPDAR